MYVRAFLAQPIGEQKIEHLTISATEHFPYGASIESTNQLHERVATEIADALFATLPQGTLDRLAAKMLMRSACSLVVGVDQ